MNSCSLLKPVVRLVCFVFLAASMGCSMDLFSFADNGSKADSKYLQGIDVSHRNGHINWRKVAQSGIVFAYAKATQGTYFKDEQFYYNWESMKANKVYRGAYHFFMPNEDPIMQAKFFLTVVNAAGGVDKDDLPPMLDVEISKQVNPAVIERKVLMWLEYVQSKTGRTPVFYTFNKFADPIFKSSKFSNYPLWISETDKEVYRVPDPWKTKKWVIWQYKFDSEVDGIPLPNVDRDRFNGNERDLNRFITLTTN